MANPIFLRPPRSTAGTIIKIRLENFMCHSNLSIEIGDYVNFITGQNGSGKSAILTALCVAFGCRAKGTQRASTLKDFIKTGCSYALVHVEIKNQGEDAFKPELYGSVVIIERRITESTSSLVIKDDQGKKVASRREELRELVEHFNIDVENPCVIMSQDKSREFLHSGNDKDKFKFFFKATLLQQVNDLLENINLHLKAANDIVCELEASIRPVEKELISLKEKIKNMEHVEEISQQVQQLKKKLAWAWVYDVDRQLQEQHIKIGKLKDRIPACQQEIDHRIRLMEELREHLTKKKAQIAEMVEETSKVRRQRDELQQILTSATKEKYELEQEYVRRSNEIQKMFNRVRVLEQQVQDIYDQHVKNTQAEEFKIEEKLKELQCEVDAADLMVARLKEAENAISESITQGMTEIRKISEELDIYEKKHHDISYSIRELRRHQTNKVTAFGGDRVINLLRVIERHHQRFKQPPIGPIGAHVNLLNGDKWAPAVEHAIGKLLNAFIVTDHKDSLLLRSMAREANYSHLQIIIYDFFRPRLNIPHHMIPQTSHPTTLSVLHSENHTVINVLVDMGSAERQVLVKDYDVGKEVAFDQRILNVKEVYTLDGYKMFSRASVQTILPPNKKIRAPRLCSSFDDQIVNLERVGFGVREEVEQCRKRKREAEEKVRHFEEDMRNVKRKCSMEERDFNRKVFALRDLKKSFAAEASPSPASTVDELHQEISKIQEEVQQKEVFLEKLQVRVREAEARANDIRESYETLCKSAEGDIHVFDEAERELSRFEKELRSAEAEKAHYEGIMKNKVLPDIKRAEELYREYEHLREDLKRL